MRVLVTGSAGRIGRHVVAELRQYGHEVVGADIAAVGTAGAMRVDLTRAGEVYGALAGCQAVVHLGAWANAGMVPDVRTYADNVTGTFHVFQACAELGVRRVVFASSAQVYGFAGEPPRYVPADEDHPLRPLNCYALAKMAGEQAAAYFVARHHLQIVSFRIMGARTPAELPAELAQVARDPAAGRQLLWTRVDARDVALACRLAVEAAAVEPGPYNLTGSRVVLDEPAADLVRRHCGERTEIRAGMDGVASPLSCARAARLLGYAPRFAWSMSQQHPES